MKNTIKLYNGDCSKIIPKKIPQKSIDLVVTSPPYDNMRAYGHVSHWNFDIFKECANEIVKSICDGGTIAWVVDDSFRNFSITGTSFKQALFFKENLGLKISSVIILKRWHSTFPQLWRYQHITEYLFVFSKGKSKTANIIRDRPNKMYGKRLASYKYYRNPDGKRTKVKRAIRHKIKKFGYRTNIWEIKRDSGSKWKTHCDHPAIFNYSVVRDILISWSNPGDTVLDPFMGSGTTGLMCQELKRKFIGIEINKDYFKTAKKIIHEKKSIY